MSGPVLGHERWAFAGLRLYGGKKQRVTRMCSRMTEEREHCKDKHGRWGLGFMGGFRNGSRWGGGCSGKSSLRRHLHRARMKDGTTRNQGFQAEGTVCPGP